MDVASLVEAQLSQSSQRRKQGVDLQNMIAPHNSRSRGSTDSEVFGI